MLDGMHGTSGSKLGRGVLAWLGLGASACPGPPPPLPELEGMVLVPGGEFTMGSDLAPNEQPIRVVQVDAFWIDETEVTVAEYTDCVDAGACEPPTGDFNNYGVEDREDHPINNVVWSGAQAYCEWVDDRAKRLPTEAEWEKAARGTDVRTYPWGDSPEPSCTHVVMKEGMNDGCGMNSTWAVGSRSMGESPYGAQDMAGNVWEWVSDWYGDDYDPGDTVNPTGPETGTRRILRGGAWIYDDLDYFRGAYRADADPRHVSYTVGFRCARTPPASQ